MRIGEPLGTGPAAFGRGCPLASPAVLPSNGSNSNLHSLEEVSAAKACAQSLAAVCEPLGLELREIEDWNCCGAAEYLGLSLTPAYALISRNMGLYQGCGTRVTTRRELLAARASATGKFWRRLTGC